MSPVPKMVSLPVESLKVQVRLSPQVPEYVAANDEIVDALLMCGHLILSNQISGKENLNATDYYKKAAYLNNAEGMYFYATNLLIGKGCNKDVVEGRKLMEKAASLGHEVAIKIINGKKENNNGN